MVAALALGACNRAGGPASARGSRASGAGPLQVVAAENVWGSIALQLAGARARVTSIITNPSSDPHDYEPNARDARTLADAQLVIVTGLGYAGWAGRLPRASPLPGRPVPEC